ncbi:MAG: hypothetical protein AAF389_00335 [Gemmatimonadota bacterium]
MSERRTIGQILTHAGRIDEEDVARALEYQREHGGFFGEALVGCGLVSEEELEWGLASQFDLPFIFPDAQAVDLDASALVSPDWALRHLALPILATDTSLQVVIDSPLKTEPIEELAERTGLTIERSLAMGPAIRSLIREVFARIAAHDETSHDPMSIAGFLDEVAGVESGRFGISVRASLAVAWWTKAGSVQRAPLVGDWRADLAAALTPTPEDGAAGRDRATWLADLRPAGSTIPVTVELIADESGREYLFRRSGVATSLSKRFTPPPAVVADEVKMLTRSGRARFVVTTEPPELGHDLLPHLPAIFLNPLWRSLYIHASDQPVADEAFSLRMDADPASWGAEIEALRTFHFDAVTVDLSGGDADWAESSLDVGSVAFLLWSIEALPAAYEAGIRWHLHVRQDQDNELEWSLRLLATD